jgi:RNA-directed DNA polymerase
MDNRHLHIIDFAQKFNMAFQSKRLWYHFYKTNQQRSHPHKLHATRFLAIQTPAELARLMIVSFMELEECINRPQYDCFQIRKLSGGHRSIEAPAGTLKRIQKRLNFFLQAYYLWIKPAEVHGFVINPKYLNKNCNIVENARAHVGRKHIMGIDLAEFFPSIRASRVREVFLSDYFQFSDQLATALALLVTYQGRLPTGAPTSPVISNFVCLEMDKALKTCCQENDIVYSRYADDMSFSADRPFTKEDIEAIRGIVEQHQFRLNALKTRLSGSNRKQKVTGLVVNQKVNVDRRFIRKTRAMLHDWSKNGLMHASQQHFGPVNGSTDRMQHKFVNRLDGYINFIGQVRGRDNDLYLSLQQSFWGCLKRQ